MPASRSSGVTPASSSTRTQSLSSGISTRLTTKPGVSLQRIGVLPSVAPELERGLEDVVGRPLGPHDLDERHQRRRVEEVHPDGTLGPLEHRCDLRHRERRGVRREDRVRANDRFERAEELVLDREVLECRLDHDVAGCEVGELGREAGARPPRREQPARAGPSRPCGSGSARSVSRAASPRDASTSWPTVSKPARRELGDARAHGTEPDDADRLDHPRHHSALDHSCDRHPEADAHRRDPVASVAALELVDKRRRDPRAGRAKRMPERDAAAVRVDVVHPLVESCRSCAVCSTTDANASLTSITAMSSSVRPGPRDAPAASPAGCRAASASGRRRRCRTTTNRARGSSPSRLTAASLAISTAAEPSTIWDEFPAVTTPSGRNAGCERGERLGATSHGAAASSTAKRAARPSRGARLLLSSGRCVRQLDRDDLAVEPALVRGGERTPVRFERVGVERLARQVPLVARAAPPTFPASRCRAAR